MQNPVSPSEYQAAHYASAKITPALSALKALNKQSLGHDESAWAETQAFMALLDQIKAKNQAIIERGNAQDQNRPIDLINRAARRQAEIPALIEREQKDLQHKHSARDFQVAELQKKNFTAAQIDRIAPPVPQSEIDASQAIVAGLQAEAESVREFLKDALRYDVELLRGTTLYPDPDPITEAVAYMKGVPMKITQERYVNAYESLNLIEAALVALSPLNLDVLSGNEVLRHHVFDLCSDLEAAKQAHREILEAGEALKDSLDPRLINRCLERIDQLQDHLEHKNGELERMKNAYENRLRDALTARVPVEQFRPLDVPPTLDDEARIARERVLIELEIERINAFLGTVPFCDFSLLAGTALEPFIPGASA
jgi:hypothetical protein